MSRACQVDPPAARTYRAPVSTPAVTHRGGCHCGAVRFSVRAPAQLPLTLCNCSICAMTGFEHLIVPATDFTLEQGEGALVEYRFNTRQARHLFCGTCGVKSFYVPRSHPDGVSVNARCLDPETVRGSTRTDFDGAHWEDAIGGLDGATGS